MSLPELVLIFCSGIFGGLYASSVGGGALISIPLLLLLGQSPHLAIGTTRFAAVPLELTSAIRFHRNKKINLRLALPLGFLASIGAALGVIAVVQVDEKTLNVIVGALLVLAAVALFYKDRLGVKEYRPNRRNNLYLALISLVLGVYGGFFGAAFGVIMAIVLALFGFTFLNSAAITRVVGFCMSAAASIVFAHYGFIDYKVGIVLGAGFAIGSWIGIGYTLKRGEGYIRLLLFSVIALSFVKILYDLLK
jgi:uncharacterized membrane protein YfcA